MQPAVAVWPGVWEPHENFHVVTLLAHAMDLLVLWRAVSGGGAARELSLLS